MTLPPENARAELEQILQTHPSNSNNPIARAHSALEHLRDTGDAHFLFLRTLLEISFDPQQQSLGNHEELLFHCITGCRQVILWQWTSQYSTRFLQTIRNSLMVLGEQPQLQTSRTCQMACFTSAVAMWKRAWCEDHQINNTSSSCRTPEEAALLERIQHLCRPPPLMTPRDLLNYIQQQILQQNHPSASLLMTCLVSEFVGKSAVSYRMPLEFHKQAHRSFEKEGPLLECLKISLQAFRQQLQQPTTNTDDNVIQLLIEVLSWEFGMAAWSGSAIVGAARTGQTLIRPPMEWREYLVGPDLIQATFQWHQSLGTNTRLSQSLRQLLLLLASLSGSIFAQPHERLTYATCLLNGALEQLQSIAAIQLNEDNPFLVDVLQLIVRIISNFRLHTLVSIPALHTLLQSLSKIGSTLLGEQVAACEQAHGDIDAMNSREWREEVLSLVLEATVLLCEDPWLLFSGTKEERREAQRQLSAVMGPLYESFVQARTRLAALEEHYVAVHEEDIDEVREEILETYVKDQLTSVAAIGRLNLSVSIQCLSNLFSTTMPQLESLWHAQGEVTPDIAALLEQSRLLTLHITSLLTDDNEGESPTIPGAVEAACQESPALANEVAAAVQAVTQFAEKQIVKIAENPSNARLSPMLASSFLMFFNRWAPAYLYPSTGGSPLSDGSNRIHHEWSTPDKAQQAIDYCVSLCLHYQSFWPHEKQVLEHASVLLTSLAKRGGHVRGLLVVSSSFQKLVQFHCLTSCIRHSATPAEIEHEIRSKGGEGILSSLVMLKGYQRVPYADKSRVLTAILIACSDQSHDVANQMISESLKVLHETFTGLLNALSNKTILSSEIHVKEMVCLCVEMFRGVTHASEMMHSERIPQFLTVYLEQLSGLMSYYSDDLSICEALLDFFCDYTECFIASLDREQSLILFRASASLLKGYSAHHCASRKIVSVKSSTDAETEESQAYSDILCALKLLINLGTKDFINACSSDDPGVESSQVTDMIFFGLQQILPLVTQGLLQYPSLCSVFFELVGFMNDAYPQKVCSLPYGLFNNLLEALLFGMSHHDAHVAKSSLFGLASIAKEHISSQALHIHLQTHPDILDRCTRRLLSEVVFQQVVVDRVEAAGMALLPVAAANGVSRFAQVVQELTRQVPNTQQQARLEAAFSTLIQPESLATAAAEGHEGRMHRAQFKKRFEAFVNEVHSFLVIR